jgi:CubicO group peptidase (beta-lactamase class C family)
MTSPVIMRPRVLVAALLVVVVMVVEAGADATGAALPGLGAYDEVMTALMRKWDVPGAGLAVARQGKLLLVRGYGKANKDRGSPVWPESVFRLASLSKTVTAVAVLQLVQEGRLRLDDRVVPILGDIGPRPGRITDARVRDISVRHLLQHAGGFDTARSGDAMFMPRAADAAKRQGGPLPPDCRTILRDTLEGRLDFTPGERFAYSNVGYCILGRVIEQVAGAPYDAHVRARILAPAGAASLRLGRTLVAAEAEVTYYDHEARMVRAMPGLGVTLAPRPYGEFAVETMDSYGGWIGTPVDYLRFLLAIDGQRGPALLDAATRALMNTPPLRPDAAADAGGSRVAGGGAFGLGIRVRPLTEGGTELWHSGSLPGTSTLAARSPDGIAWVVAFNGRPRDRAAFRSELERALWTAKNKVKPWPDGDLFR